MGRISAKRRFEQFRRSNESIANSNVPNPGKGFFRKAKFLSEEKPPYHSSPKGEER